MHQGQLIRVVIKTIGPDSIPTPLGPMLMRVEILAVNGQGAHTYMHVHFLNFDEE